MFPVMSAGNPITGYNINNSLRFRSSASAYLARTFGTPTTTNVWTWSCWVKRGALGVAQTLMDAGDGVGTTQYLTINSSDQLYWNASDTAGNNIQNLYTTAVFRDPAAWYHIVAVFNTPNATSTSRAQLYVNGVLQTVTYALGPVAQNATSNWNKSGALGRMGKLSYASAQYVDGYMTEINFIDGQALTPSSFGATDAITGQWLPKQYSGTYGSNGFYLKFSDIATTSGSNAGLGKDFSGNGNYWTTNNISVTAGTTYDAMTDSPTLTSATVANYATFNSVQVSSYITLSEANLRSYGNTSSDNGLVFSTIAVSSGKWYYEYTSGSANNGYPRLGVGTTFVGNGTYAGLTSVGGIGLLSNGQIVYNSTTVTTVASFTAGDVIGVAYDLDNLTVKFYKNNTLLYTFTGLPAGTYFASNSEYNFSYGYINFGQRPFSYTPPTGYVALNTYNLPTPTIKAGNKYMDATTFTGTSGAQSIVNQGQFKPDFIWIKSRSNAQDNWDIDSVRGGTNLLRINTTGAETTYSTPAWITSFNSNGFSSDSASLITTGYTYVAWQWQAGQGSTSSNTSGSITSTTSVNTTAGFSVVTYTGTGANATVGHGLGVAPKMIIIKSRSAVTDWAVYHTSIGATNALFLNRTLASSAGISYFNNTSPTSSVFSLGYGGDVNPSAATMVAYCWAEIAGFSKFGSYTGNGSADGTFVYTGFRPKYIMIKMSSGINSWALYDTTRQTYNSGVAMLLAEASDAEYTATYLVDILSNGFKFRATNGIINASGSTYIYMAFAENPFKHANAR